MRISLNMINIIFKFLITGILIFKIMKVCYSLENTEEHKDEDLKKKTTIRRRQIELFSIHFSVHCLYMSCVQLCAFAYLFDRIGTAVLTVRFVPCCFHLTSRCVHFSMCVSQCHSRKQMAHGWGILAVKQLFRAVGASERNQRRTLKHPNTWVIVLP